MQDTKNQTIDKIQNKIEERIYSNKEIALIQLNDIISKLPPSISELIQEGFDHKRIPKEYLLSSILFAFGNASGLAFKTKCLSYINYTNLYFVIIGSRGDVKSPAMKLACDPLNTYDDNEYDLYIKSKPDDEDDNSFIEESKKIKRKQLLVQNATIQAVTHIHYQNPYSIGIFIDELYYLFDQMANKNSSDGTAWRTFLLQGNTNSHVDIARKTADSYRIKKSCPYLLGSIQDEFIPKMFANGNLESGLIDRFLFTTKLTNNSKISTLEIPVSVMENYKNSLTNLLKYRRSIEETQEELFINFEKAAYSKIHKYSQSLLDKIQREINVECEYISKMLISIHKLVLLCHLMIKSQNDAYQDKISAYTVELAILINEYYYTHFKIVLEKRKNNFDNKKFITEVIKKAVNNEVSQTEIVKLTGLSKSYISKLYAKQIKDGN
ncbi:DUF3987 domain-containing protein [Paucihalobacter ruber]|uniref:DUF3987 domain-containing protein n=1 Tax=Paucihalobacter ruber TaxID=2567861 RepID=A0A506PHB1_9FLAO|nr:DUF3987 domain-containing protein [Paucihalobacter ruber]TPV33223.1 DUF3987 domain-containing protein [Paucihalobacter ruber]